MKAKEPKPPKEKKRWLVHVRIKPPEGGKAKELPFHIEAESVFVDGRGALVLHDGNSRVVACFQAGSWTRLANEDKVTAADPPMTLPTTGEEVF